MMRAASRLGSVGSARGWMWSLLKAGTSLGWNLSPSKQSEDLPPPLYSVPSLLPEKLFRNNSPHQRNPLELLLTCPHFQNQNNRVSFFLSLVWRSLVLKVCF